MSLADNPAHKSETMQQQSDIVANIVTSLTNVAQIWAACASLVMPRFIVMGSSCLPELTEPESSTSDVDIVCVAGINTRPESFFCLANSESFVCLLLQSGHATDIRVISAAIVPIIKCVVCSTDVDILYMELVPSQSLSTICSPSTFDPLAIDAFEYVAPMHHRQLKSMRMYLTVYNHRPPSPAGNHLVSLIRLFRKWTKARCIYGTKYGFGGGATCILLAVIVLWLIPVSDDESFVSVAQKSFQFLALHPWPVPLCLPSHNHNDSQEMKCSLLQESVGMHTSRLDAADSMHNSMFDEYNLPRWFNNPCAALANGLVVLTPPDGTNVFNSTHNSTVYTANIFRAECVRAQAACALNDFLDYETICRPYSLIDDRPSDYFLMVCIDDANGTVSESNMQRFSELVESRLLVVASQMHAIGLCCRFWPRFLRAIGQTSKGIFIAAVHQLVQCASEDAPLDASPVQDVFYHAISCAMEKNVSQTEGTPPPPPPIIVFVHISQLPQWIKQQLMAFEVSFDDVCP